MAGVVRRELRLRGVVQGVGLRPWAARRARALGLAGEVGNAAWGVRVVLEGERRAVAAWREALDAQPPPGCRVDAIEERELPCRGARGFAVVASDAAAHAAPTRIPPDRPLCEACLRDLFDPADRRHRYAFTHCASCGPRASLLRELPYDRERTSLAAFPPCTRCRREYADPDDRRFHAESIACPDCGPRLAALDPEGREVAGDAVEAAAACLRRGGIVAVKGYGGFHLACDATRPEAVARLRKRKARPSKPLAVLVPDLGAAREAVELGSREEAWLVGPARAVVVAPRRGSEGGVGGIAAEVAPRTGDLGLILPVAPVHWLLLHGPGTRPGSHPPRFPALVFTSANPSAEPTVHADADVASLASLADLVLTHDRAVARPSDDSVVRSAPGSPIPLRLSRGVAPLSLPLPGGGAAPVVLAVGGDLKSAPAVLVRGEVVLGEHVGDLGSVASADALEERASALCRMLEARPAIVAHDLHPDSIGAGIADQLARRWGARSVAVQHHHAHAAACLVEHGRETAALALVLDGAGWGPDGTIWGGELLRVDARGARRLAHLEPVPLPGGDAAVREPWRMAWSWLRRAFPAGDAPRLPWHARRGDAELARISRAVERGVASPPTSSCGRLFDAVASLLDLGDRSGHEGELAVALESLAETADDGMPCLPLRPEPEAVGDERVPLGDLVRELALAHARGVPPAALARAFHAGLAARLAAAAAAAARATGLEEVVLSGGCLQNRRLRAELEARLAGRGLRPLVHRRLPPSDAALAVGQAAVAARPTGPDPAER